MLGRWRVGLILREKLRILNEKLTPAGCESYLWSQLPFL